MSSLLQDFATHAEIALQNARLFEENAQTMRVLQQSQNEKSALLMMVKPLNSELVTCTDS